MQAARHEWQESQPTLDITKLVFPDETGASTNMTRTRGWAQRGERCVASVPHGHWKTTTFIAALRVNELTAPMVLDGPMNGEAFLVYVQQFLCPTLKPGDIVIADNLPSHTVAGVKEAIEATGATLRYLPPYTPDLNPIENASPSSKPSSEKQPAVPSMHSGQKSENYSTPSHHRKAKTTSKTQRM